ncbi:MAG: choice-of-anchor X domain-containing protein [Candidatus Hodarchaeota archaeon]
MFVIVEVTTFMKRCARQGGTLAAKGRALEKPELTLGMPFVRWTFAMLVVLALLFPFAACSQTKTIVRESKPCPKAKLPIDLPAVGLQIAVVKDKAPRKTLDRGAIEVVLQPNVDVSKLVLEISGAGSVKLHTGKNMKSLPPGSSFLPSVPIRDRVQMGVEALKAKRRQVLTLPFQVVEDGYGYIMVRTLGPDGKATESTSTMILYVLSLSNRVYFSRESLQDLDVQKLETDLKRKGKSPEQIQREIEKLRRSGAKVKKTSRPGIRKGGSENDGGPYNSITVEGHVRFTDVNGGTHPVRFAVVEILDDEGAAPEELVTTTHTDDTGFYSVTVDDNDGDGTGRDIVVRAQASGDAIQVVRNDGTGDVLEIDSGAPVMDVVDGTTQTIDLTAINNAASDQNVAFEVYEAMNKLARYLQTLGEPLPAQINVNLFSTLGFSYYSGGEIFMEAIEVHFWDTMYHEYGHHIQHLYNTANNPGGPHNSCNNDCGTGGRDKDEGVRMAWAESWPTFFGSMAQIEMGLGAMGIPNVADARHTQGNGVDYDLELETDGCTNGEGSERVVMRVLWDFYDNANDDQDQGVALSAHTLWDLVVDNEPHTFSAFWNYLIAGRPQSERQTLARILTRYGVSAEPTSPPNGQDYDGTGAAPTFQWNGPVSCDTGGNARYSVKLYNDALTTLIYESPWQSGTSFIPSNDQINQIFVGPDAPVRWLVTFRDLSDPVTGNYDGQDRTVDDRYDPPDRNPVDIVLALDISGSMNGSVPGSMLNMKKLELLQQAVELFVRTWAMHAIPDDRIGVLYFSTNLSTVAGLGGLVDVAANANTIIISVNGQSPLSCTAIGGVTQHALDLLEASDNKKAIILFTDGEQTHNPMVTEEGTPPKLKIRQLAPGAMVPFGGYWCDGTAAANDPDGIAIVPDGDFIEDHGIQIHTIGVGVNGAAFEDLIDRISSETLALHHYTSAPDEDLDIFFTNDLIDSLKTATLEIVKTDKGPLGRGATRTISVPVNSSSSLLSLVISWKGEMNPSAVGVEVRAPDGTAVSPTNVDQGSFFKVMKYTFPLKARTGKPLSPVGNWTVKLTGQASAESLLYQFTAFVDERCFHYDFDFERRAYAPGDKILLTATLTQNGKPLPQADGVWVDVTAPTFSAHNLLADALQGAKSGKGIVDTKLLDLKRDYTDMTLFDQAVASVIHSDKKLAAQLRSKTRMSVGLYDDGRADHGDAVAGDGIYSNLFAATKIAGSYQFQFHVITPTACGRVERSEISATSIIPRKFDPRQSCVTVRVVNGVATVTVRPQDRFGNLLGAGRPHAVDILVSSGKALSPIVDNWDGTYSQEIAIPKEWADLRVAVIVQGKTLLTAPLSRLIKHSLSRSHRK